MDAYTTDADHADEAKWETADALHDQQQEERGMKIREEEEWDRLPDPEDMSYTEAQICNNISNCGNEIDMIDGTIRLLVQQMLLHWGFATDQTKIDVSIKVRDAEEAIT